MYDASVTVSINTEPEDDYDEFCVALCKMITIKGDTWSGDLICNWSEFIKRNMVTFRNFANKHWYKNNFADEDDFICEWIEELHLFLAGYGEDGAYGFYKAELLDECK